MEVLDPAGSLGQIQQGLETNKIKVIILDFFLILSMYVEMFVFEL